MESTVRALRGPSFYDILNGFFRGAAAYLAKALGQARGASASSDEINAAAERLLDAYGDSILRMAYSYLHNMDDAEDIVQDTLIQYIKKRPVFNDSSYEKAWCLRVAANLSKNRIRYNRVRAADELSEELAEEKREDLSFVWEAVKELPVKYREVIHLFYHEGFQTAQISQILQRNETTVRSQLLRGREQLKTILKEAYDFDRQV